MKNKTIITLWVSFAIASIYFVWLIASYLTSLVGIDNIIVNVLITLLVYIGLNEILGYLFKNSE